MDNLLRWLGIGLLVFSIPVSQLLDEGGAPPSVATPAAASPVPFTIYDYRSDQPVIVIRSGPMTATLRVDRLPTDRYGAVTVATDSDAPFRFTITPPQGETRTIFEADAPDALTGALLLDQTGDYTLTVEASGMWALIIR